MDNKWIAFQLCNVRRPKHQWKARRHRMVPLIRTKQWAKRQNWGASQRAGLKYAFRRYNKWGIRASRKLENFAEHRTSFSATKNPINNFLSRQLQLDSWCQILSQECTIYDLPFIETETLVPIKIALGELSGSSSLTTYEEAHASKMLEMKREIGVEATNIFLTR